MKRTVSFPSTTSSNVFRAAFCTIATGANLRLQLSIFTKLLPLVLLFLITGTKQGLGQSSNMNDGADLQTYEFSSAVNPVILTEVPPGPVHNLIQNTYYATIQLGVNAANPGEVLECAAGIYNEMVTITKSLTLQGIDSATTIIDGTGLPSTPASAGGITVAIGVTNVTIKKLAVRNFTGSGGNASAGIWAQGNNDNLTIDFVSVYSNPASSGIYVNVVHPNGISNVTITNCRSSGHGPVARGISIWNGLKTNINISNNKVYSNNCCGIEIQQGTCTGVTMSNNNVFDNFDNGMSANGMTSPGVNVISGNTLANNGRFGIEIKNPDGTGAASGPGSIVVSNNNVSMTAPIPDALGRDGAGIAVFRRDRNAGGPVNVDVPKGVRVLNNTVNGYRQPNAVGEGYGIVAEGLDHTVSANILNNNDIGIQRQGGYLLGPYPGNGDANATNDFFGRGNSPTSCNITLTGNIYGNILANSINTRDQGNVPPDPTITPGGPITLCPGGSQVLTSSAATGNQWYKNNVLLTGEINTTYTATTSGSYTVISTVSMCASSPSSPVVVSVYASNSWTGASNTSWNDPLNWTCGVPTATTDVLIPAGTPNPCVIPAGTALAHNLVINLNASLTNNGTLQINGGGIFTNNGSFTNNGIFNQ